MPLNKYRVLTKIAESGNMSKTAQDMMYTQQALSRIIKCLESEYGFSLFLRTRDGVELTSKCQKILPLVKEIIDAEDRLLDEIAIMNEKQSDTIIHVGACGSVVMDYLHNALSAFIREYPDISVDITYDANYITNIDKLNKNEFDCVLTVEGKHGLMHFEPLFRQDFYAVLPKGHPLENKSNISMNDLLDYPIVVPVDNPSFDEISKKSKNVIVVDEEIMMLPIIARASAVGITTGIDHFCVDHELIKRPLIEGYHRIIGVATRPGEKKTENLEKLLQIFRET